MLIWCPWPDRELWPNGRPNVFAKARKVKAYRDACNKYAKSARVHKMRWPDGEIHVHLIFHPKTKRKPDDDNLEAAFKSGRDGIAEAMGVDDANWRVTREIADPMKGGAVVVDIRTPALVDVPVIGSIS